MEENPLQDQGNRAIWSAFGSYLAKELLNGRGIMIPKFGHFTFTAAELDLQGTTNPQVRDKQIRTPVFMVAKDFAPSMALRSGIVHITPSGAAALRPLELRGASGVIPKVKFNYVEVATIASKSKEQCRDVCEMILKSMADQVRKGAQLQIEIPQVGRFMVRNLIAAVSFTRDMVEQTRGQTTRAFTIGNLFGTSNSTLNLKIGENYPNRTQMKVTDGASCWLAQNMGITIDEMHLDEQNLNNPHVTRSMSAIKRADSHQVLQGNQYLTGDRLSELNFPTKKTGPHSRPMSSAIRSHTTEMASHMSFLPKTDRFALQTTADVIFKSRQQISQFVLAPGSNQSLRDIISSSQIFSILKKAQVKVELIALKQLLQELGFPFNGPSTSFTALMTACKSYLQGMTGVSQGNLNHSEVVTEYSGLTPRVANKKEQGAKICNLLRDVFYTSAKTLFELFRLGMSGNYLDQDGLHRIVDETSGGKISADDIDTAWSHVMRNGRITFEQFESAFKSEVPTGLDFETKVIRQVREWMYKNQLSAELAFDSLCRSVGKFIEKRLNRALFHRSFIQNEVGLSAARIDSLFAALCSEANGEIDLNCWLSRIYEDSDNPLQMVREIVERYDLTQDDLLHQMQLKPWDAAMDLAKLRKVIRNLDQSIGDSQITALFKSLKNRSETVEVETLIQNFTGKPYETVEFRDKIFKVVYNEIYPNNEDKIIQMLSDKDVVNEGKVNQRQLFDVLNKIIKSVKSEDIERFVRFLETDSTGQVTYMEFISDLQKAGNKNHNPFKSVINRLNYFLKHNQVSATDLLKRISTDSARGVPVDEFCLFLKQKVDKKRDSNELRKHARQMDVDKDGFVSAADIDACIKNLHQSAFWKNGGAALAKSTFNTKTKFYPVSSGMPKEKVLEVIRQINEGLGKKRITYRECFDTCDQDQDNMVSCAEFLRGLSSMLTLSQPVLEQLYSVMDKTGVGLITYDQFLNVLRLQQIERPRLNDNFDWEATTIQRIRDWIISKKYTCNEAFKLFDQDFDGFVSKADLNASLIKHLEIPSDQILSFSLDRLFRLLDFFKTGRIQPSDFQRVIQGGNNPYSSSKSSRGVLAKTLGGTFVQGSTFDWKFGSVQQIGLILSRRYASLKDSFCAASQNKLKIQFDDFKDFLNKEEALTGFNLTPPLIQQLFSELDPHKKGFLSEQDWSSAFKAFNWKTQIFVELKDAIQCYFVGAESAFNFFLSCGVGGQQAIDRIAFKKGALSLMGEHHRDKDIEAVWSQLSKDGKITSLAFRQSFEALNYTGSQTIKSVPHKPSGSKTKSLGRSTVRQSSSIADKWEGDVIAKLKGILKTSKQNLGQIFTSFDTDGSGKLTLVEFRNAIRKLGLGLSSKEIDTIMTRSDINGDQMIDYREFCSQQNQGELENKLHDRLSQRLARLKELMIMHMTSANDAFRFFDKAGDGALAFSDFNRLVTRAHELANEKAPAYPVVCDLFESVDIRRDGVIDLDEWQQTFGSVVRGDAKLSIRATSTTMWENSKDFERIGFLVAKNRKQLMECFKRTLGGRPGTLFSFAEGRAALDDWLHQNFGGRVTNEQLKCMFRVALDHSESQQEPHYDYERMLDIYKQRHFVPQSK